MLATFLNALATIISVTSLLVVTYGALIGIISFWSMSSKDSRASTQLPISGSYGPLSELICYLDLNFLSHQIS